MTYPLNAYETFQLEEIVPSAWQRHLARADTFPCGNQASDRSHPAVEEIASYQRESEGVTAESYHLIQGTYAPPYSVFSCALAGPVNVATVDNYVSPQQMLPSREICYQAAPMTLSPSRASEVLVGPCCPPSDYPTPHYVGYAMGLSVEISIPPARLAHNEAPLVMPAPRRAVVGGVEDVLVPSRPQWRPTLAELEREMMRSSRARRGFEGYTLNQTTMTSRTTARRNGSVDSIIPEAVKASGRGRSLEPPQQVQESGEGLDHTAYGAARPSCNECDVQFRHVHELWRHLRETKAHGGARFRCNACAKAYTRKDALTNHKRKNHSAI